MLIRVVNNQSKRLEKRIGSIFTLKYDLECSTLKMEALHSSETFIVTLPVALGYILKDCNLQPTNACSYFGLFVYNTTFSCRL